jgi:hypothetical protein
MDYTTQLNEINDGFYLIIDELVLLIPNYRTYPNLPTYAENYGAALQNFKEIQAEFFMLKNNIENDLQVIDNNIEIKNSQIGVLDAEINVLKDRLDSLINSNDAGEGLLTDTELLHNQKYVGNMILLITVLGLCYMNKSLVNTYLD